MKVYRVARWWDVIDEYEAVKVTEKSVVFEDGRRAALESVDYNYFTDRDHAVGYLLARAANLEVKATRCLNRAKDIRQSLEGEGVLEWVANKG